MKANAVIRRGLFTRDFPDPPVIGGDKSGIAQKGGPKRGLELPQRKRFRWFRATYYALHRTSKDAPWREWDFKGRSDLIAYSQKHNIPITATHEKPYSTDRNLMHVSYEGGILEDPGAAPPEDIFQMTRPPENAKAEAEHVEISFEHGEPVAIDGKKLGPVAVLESLNRKGGEHGIGRVDLVENRFVGMKSRGVYETLA